MSVNEATFVKFKQMFNTYMKALITGSFKIMLCRYTVSNIATLKSGSYVKKSRLMVKHEILTF